MKYKNQTIPKNFYTFYFSFSANNTIFVIGKPSPHRIIQVDMKKYSLYILMIFFLPAGFIYAQTPTMQDCMGAIPICQDVYSESSSFTGTGNYTNEINWGTSCLINGEENSVWYTFTVQTSGIFRFTLTPNDIVYPGDDYDWSLYNLTNATCAQIYNNPSLEISCNSWGVDYFDSLFCGPTGISTAMGGVGNSNGPGSYNGPPWNADINVAAGNTYVLEVSNCNYTGADNGYVIDFSPSTATIFDDVPPEVDSIMTSLVCGTAIDTIAIKFSENILCNTVEPSDFIIEGSGGPYTVTSIYGSACSIGGNQEKNFTIRFSPPINESGDFYLILSETNSGSVADLCSNLAEQDSFKLHLTVSIQTETGSADGHCGHSDGEAHVTATGGSGNYTYTWNTNPAAYVSSVTGLTAGMYIVTVTDAPCSKTDTAIINDINTINADFTYSPDIITALEGTYYFSDISGNAVVWLWNFGDGSTSEQQYPSHSYSEAGSYIVTLTATDNFGCTDSIQKAVNVREPLTIYIPNSFTPGNDGKNDYFAPVGEGIEQYTFIMYIFDRWGNLVYETHDINKPWYGTFNNKKAVQGVYNYRIIIKDEILGKEYGYVGNVNVIL